MILNHSSGPVGGWQSQVTSPPNQVGLISVGEQDAGPRKHQTPKSAGSYMRPPLKQKRKKVPLGQDFTLMSSETP